MEHADRERWNDRYRERSPEAFGLEPSDWLLTHQELLSDQPGGAALDLACGNGRNALFLTRFGFDVEAIDISDVAIRWLEAHSRKEGLSIRARAGDLATEAFPGEKYQVIMNFNFLDRRLFAVIEAALAPGGLVFFETFTLDHIRKLGSTMPEAFVLQPGELLRAFPGLQILDSREGIFVESSKARQRAVASVAARKPGTAPLR